MRFRDKEKRRYEGIKNGLFTAAALRAGQYRGKTYPFCLADDHSSENLHESIRDEAIAYFRARRIPWHDGFDDSEGNARALPSNHLCCSQSACVNALAPMMRDADLLARSFSVFIPELAEPILFDADDSFPNGGKPLLAFEWTGKDNYLGETNWGTRGANATSADFGFRFRRFDGRVQLVLGEWKYTEFYSDPLKDPAKLNPTQLRVYREAFDRWNKRQSDLPPYETFFAEPFYQLMRQSLLAMEMELARKSGPGEMEADVVTVVHVSPKANREYATSFTSPTMARYGRTVTAAWANLAPPDRFTAISLESLLTTIDHAAGQQHRRWADWLLDRYGWWRGESL